MKKIFGISLTLILVAMLFMGCGGKDDEDDTTTSATATTSHAPTTSITGTPPSTTPTTTAASSTPATSTPVSSTPATSGSAFSDIFGKSTAITNFYVEIKVTSPEGTQNMKEWVKTGNPSKFRMEIAASGQTMIMIFNGLDYYMYDPASKVAYKMSMSAAQQYSSASGDASSSGQYNPILVGSETVNGIDCYVYQYTVQGVTTKIWLSKQNGLTVRMVSGSTTMDYTNYSFAAIADSMFTLPADAMMITMPF